MSYIIRKKERKDCKDIAQVVTVAWNETYKGIVPDEFLNNLYTNEEQRAIDSFNNFDEENNHQFVLEVDNKVVGFVNIGITDLQGNPSNEFYIHIGGEFDWKKYN